MKPYPLTYTVTAATELEATTNAVAMLRTGVVLLSVQAAQRISGVLWRVTLLVRE